MASIKERMKATSPVEALDERDFSSRWTNSIWFRIVLITAVSLGVFFRIAGLGNKLYSHDETFTSMYAAGYHPDHVYRSLWDRKDKTAGEIKRFLTPDGQKSMVDTLSAIALTGPQQSPLFFVIEYYWMRVVGHTPAAMRALATLFGLLAIPAMYWFGKELFRSSRTALLSAAIFALSPFHVLFAQDARFYSLWALATILSGAVLLQAMRKKHWSAWLIYSLTLVLGFYSHQLFVLVAVVHGIYFAATYFLDRRKGLHGFLIAAVLAVLAYSPWLFVTLRHWQIAVGQMEWVNTVVPWYRYLQRWTLVFSSPLIDLDLNSDFANIAPYLLRACTLVFAGFAIAFLLRHGSWREKWFLVLLYLITGGSFIVLDLFLGGIRSITGRYFVPANIATVLVVAFFLKTKFDRSRANTLRWWTALTGVLMLSAVLSNVNSLLADTWWNKELSRARMEFVRVIDKDQTLLIVTGGYPTILGDVLLLGLQVESDVHFRLDSNIDQVSFTGDYQNIYWFPSSHKEYVFLSERERLLTTEVLQDTLWRIDGTHK